MYSRVPLVVLLPLVGLSAMPGASPALRVARFLLAVAGMGFGVYLLAAFGLLVARFSMYGRRRRKGPIID